MKVQGRARKFLKIQGRARRFLKIQGRARRFLKVQGRARGFQERERKKLSGILRNLQEPPETFSRERAQERALMRKVPEGS